MAKPREESIRSSRLFITRVKCLREATSQGGPAQEVTRVGGLDHGHLAPGGGRPSKVMGHPTPKDVYKLLGVRGPTPKDVYTLLGV